MSTSPQRRSGAIRGATVVTIAAVGTALVVVAAGALFWPSGEPQPQAVAPARVADDPPESPAPRVLTPEILSTQAEEPAEEPPHPGLTVFDLRAPATSFAYDHQTSRLFALEAEGETLAFYDVGETLEFVRAVPLKGEPRSIVVKRYGDRRAVVVSETTGGSLHLVDATSGDPLGAVHTEFDRITQLIADRSDSPYVYYGGLAWAGEQQEGQIGRINLRSRDDEGTGYEEDNTAFISPDGRRLYTRGLVLTPVDRGSGPVADKDGPGFLTKTVYQSPRRYKIDPAYRMPEDDDAPSERHVDFYESGSTPFSYVADPDGDYVVAASTKILDTELRDLHGWFDFAVDGFVPGAPWVFGADGGEFTVGSLNDHRIVVRLPVPDDLAPSSLAPPKMRLMTLNPYARRSIGWERRRPRPVYYDSAHERFVIASERRVATISRASLSLPDEPRLYASVPTPPRFDPTAPGRFEIPIGDPRIETRLLSAPRGLTLDEGALVWNPPPRQTIVGQREVTLERRLGDLVLNQKQRIEFERASVKLPGVPGYASVSPDGEAIALLCRQLEIKDADATKWIVVLADPVGPTLLKSETVDLRGVPSAIALGDDALYVATGGVSRRAGSRRPHLIRLETSGLTLTHRVGLPDLASAIGVVSGKGVVAEGALRSLEDLETIGDPADYNRQAMEEMARERTAWRLKDGWVWDGAVWDDAAESVRLLHDCRGFVVDRGAKLPELPTPWGPNWDVDKVVDKDRLVLRLDPGMSSVSGVMPAAFALGTRRPRGAPEYRVVSVYDLAEGKAVSIIPLGPSPQRRARSSKSLYAESGGTIVACVDDLLFTLRSDEIDAAALPMPPRVELRQSTLLLESGTRAKLRYRVAGGRAPYRVSVAVGKNDQQTVETERDAEVAVYVADLVEDAMANLTSADWPKEIRKPKNDPRESVLDYLALIGPRFERLVGRKPKGFPVAMPVEVQSADRDNRVTRLRHFCLVELPLPDVIDQLTIVRTLEGRLSQRRLLGRSTEVEITQLDRRKQQERRLDLELAVAFSRRFRSDYPHREVRPERLPEEIEAAREKTDRFLVETMRTYREQVSKEPRRWVDTSGAATAAKLVTAFGDQVVLSIAGGGEMTLPLEKLSEPDRRFLDSLRDEPTLGDGSSPDLHVELLMKLFADHRRRHAAWPPAYLVDDNGNPILSWRVALLSQMGGGEMLRLMRLDQEWNSEHNRRFHGAMPKVFSTDPQALEQHDATLIAITGDSALIGDGRPRTLSGAGRARADSATTVLIAEASMSGARPWMAPRDIEIENLRSHKSAFKDRDGWVLVGVATGRCRALPVSLGVDDWTEAISRTGRGAARLPWGTPPREPAGKATTKPNQE